jgi:molecular chaperone DnaK
MVKDAEANAESDKQKKALIEARNAADSLIHSTEKSVAEFGDKVTATDKSAIEAAMTDLKSVKDGEDVEAITSKTQTLMQAAMKLGEAMYAAQQADATAGEGGAHKDDGVVDAEFEEVSDDKKSA